MQAFKFPIDRRTARVKWNQLQLKQQQLTNELNLHQKHFGSRVYTANNRIQLLKESIDNFQINIEPKQKLIYEKTLLQYRQGEIDFLRFIQIQERVLNHQNKYLEQVKLYNEQILNLMYLKQN